MEGKKESPLFLCHQYTTILHKPFVLDCSVHVLYYSIEFQTVPLLCFLSFPTMVVILFVIASTPSPSSYQD